MSICRDHDQRVQPHMRRAGGRRAGVCVGERAGGRAGRESGAKKDWLLRAVGGSNSTRLDPRRISRRSIPPGPALGSCLREAGAPVCIKDSHLNAFSVAVHGRDHKEREPLGRHGGSLGWTLLIHGARKWVLKVPVCRRSQAYTSKRFLSFAACPSLHAFSAPPFPRCKLKSGKNFIPRACVQRRQSQSRRFNRIGA
jgi:hypothetical protein